MPEVEFPSNGSSASGYLATPEPGHGPAVVVLQEWWGLVPEIRGVCDSLAREGFLALAPDLYHGETTEQPDEAEQKMMAMQMDRTAAEMSGAVDFLAGHEGHEGERVGALGFCLGGGLAVWAASVNPKIAATVSYYYVMPHGKPDFAAIHGPVLGHFGKADEFVPVHDARKLEQEMRDAGVPVEFHFYEEAGHAFMNEADRLGTYNPEVAGASWNRTIRFLEDNLA